MARNCPKISNPPAPRRKWAERDGGPLGHLRLAARPGQIVRAVLILDQTGIDLYQK